MQNKIGAVRMSKKKSEVRCPHCGNIEFTEQSFFHRDTPIRTIPKLERGEPCTKQDEYSYRCTKCSVTYCAFSAEEFYEKLKRIIELSGKTRYVADCANRTIVEVTVTGTPANPDMNTVWCSDNSVHPGIKVVKAIARLYKTKREAREHLLEYLKQQMAYKAHMSEESQKEFAELQKKYNEVKRSIR